MIMIVYLKDPKTMVEADLLNLALAFRYLQTQTHAFMHACTYAHELVTTAAREE